MNYSWILYSIIALIASTLHMTYFKYLTKINFPHDLCIAIIFILTELICFFYLLFNLTRFGSLLIIFSKSSI